MRERLVYAALLVALVTVPGCKRDSGTHLAQGDALLARGEAQRALDEYLQALRIAPSARAERGAGLAYAALGSTEQAESHLKLALSVQPVDSEARVTLALIYAEAQRHEEARRELRAALEDRPQEPDALLLLASYADDGAELRDAIAALEALGERQRLRGNVERELQILLAHAYERDGRPEQAASYKKLARLASLGSEAATLRLARLCVERGRWPLAYDLLHAVLERRPHEGLASELLARAALELGHTLEARRALEHVPSERRQLPGVRLLAARIALASDLQTESERALEELLEEAKRAAPPLVPHIRYALAQAFAAQRKRAEAKAELERLLVELPDALDARVRLAQFELDEERPDLALARLASLPPAHPALAAAHETKGRAYLLQGDAKAAEGAYQKLLELAPGMPEARHGLAQARLRLGRAQEARALLEENLGHFPTHEPSLNALCALLRARESQRAADKRALEHWAAHPSSAAVSTLEGDWHAGRREFGKALAAYQRAVTLHPSYLPAVAALGRYYARRRLSAQALAIVDAALAQSPDEIELLLLAAEIASDVGEHAHARRHLERLLRVQPSYPAGLAQLARSTVQAEGDLAIARAYAEQALVSAPGNPDVLDAAGWLRYLASDVAGGLSLLEVAVDGDPGNPRSRYHLAMVLAAAGKRALARQNVDALLTYAPDYADARAINEQLVRASRTAQ